MLGISLTNTIMMIWAHGRPIEGAGVWVTAADPGAWGLMAAEVGGYWGWGDCPHCHNVWGRGFDGRHREISCPTDANMLGK